MVASKKKICVDTDTFFSFFGFASAHVLTAILGHYSLTKEIATQNLSSENLSFTFGGIFLQALTSAHSSHCYCNPNYINWSYYSGTFGMVIGDFITIHALNNDTPFVNVASGILASIGLNTLNGWFAQLLLPYVEDQAPAGETAKYNSDL